MRTPRQVVVVGNGMAGARLATELAARPAGDPVRVRVTVFGDEPEPAYNRVLLSQVLAGNLPAGGTALPAPAGPTVDVHTGHRVVAIRPDRRTVVVRSRPGVEQEIGYDHLVLATGGRPIVPRLRGLDPDRLPDRVAVFRTLADCRRILAVADQARTALVLGGGLLGLEAARGLAGRGLRVTVVHAVGHLMERQLDPAASAVLVDTLTRLGITTLLDAVATAVTAHPGGVTVVLADGRKLTADLLVISCGVRPETGLAAAAGLTVDGGIVVDERLRTSDPRISALGDCARFGDAVTGLVAPAWEQARVLARRLGGGSAAGANRYRPLPPVVRLKADGIDLAAMGTVDAAPEQLTFTDPTRGTYARLAIEAGRLAGAVLIGDNPSVGTIVQLFDRGGLVPADRRGLLLGHPIGTPGAVADPAVTAAGLPDAATVCQCLAVTKRVLVRSWHGGARTGPELVAATRATTGCGGCRDAVDGIAAWLTATAPPPVPQPTHDLVGRGAIK